MRRPVRGGRARVEARQGATTVACDLPFLRGEGRRRFRYDEFGQVAAVYCRTCKTFKYPEAFGAGVKFKDVRPQGFHESCRVCLTKLRQDYRERHKVPCDRCGKPRLPAGEKGSRKNDSGLCKACYVKSITKVSA